MKDECTEDRLERLYQRYLKGGHKEALTSFVPSEDIALAFRRTSMAVARLRGKGPFYRPGQRKSLFDLARERGPLGDQLKDTQHLQAMLWNPTRWRVEGHPELDFVYLDREISPGAEGSDDKRSWIIDPRCKISTDLLLMNANPDDRTPIVAEFKRGGDKNADYALVQALAAAAQLSAKWQRKRLGRHYSEYLGASIPECLDVYVILADPPPRGTRPKLLARALERAAELQADRQLQPSVRRIEFLEVLVERGKMTFKRLTVDFPRLSGHSDLPLVLRSWVAGVSRS